MTTQAEGNRLPLPAAVKFGNKTPINKNLLVDKIAVSPRVDRNGQLPMPPSGSNTGNFRRGSVSKAISVNFDTINKPQISDENGRPQTRRTSDGDGLASKSKSFTTTDATSIGFSGAGLGNGAAPLQTGRISAAAQSIVSPRGNVDLNSFVNKLSAMNGSTMYPDTNVFLNADSGIGISKSEVEDNLYDFGAVETNIRPPPTRQGPAPATAIRRQTSNDISSGVLRNPALQGIRRDLSMSNDSNGSYSPRHSLPPQMRLGTSLGPQSIASPRGASDSQVISIPSPRGLTVVRLGVSDGPVALATPRSAPPVASIASPRSSIASPRSVLRRAGEMLMDN